ncbi:MAG: hypothetical protein QM778_13535 [Myxococcales bacterium]
MDHRERTEAPHEPHLSPASSAAERPSSGGYAYHDQSRVDTLHGPGARRARRPRAQQSGDDVAHDTDDEALHSGVRSTQDHDQPAPEQAAAVEKPGFPSSEIERLVALGAWDRLIEQIPPDGTRAPLLVLLRSIAAREGTARGARADAKLTSDAIAALAEVLGVPASSPIALMLGKRLLRRNPWSGTTQPSQKLSFTLMVFGVAAGAGIGWLVTRLML